MAINEVVYPSSALGAVPLVRGNYSINSVLLDSGEFERGSIMYNDAESGKAKVWQATEETVFDKQPADIAEKQIELPAGVPAEFTLTNSAGTVTYTAETDYTVSEGVLTLVNDKDAAKEAELKANWTTPGDPDPVSHSETLTVPSITIDIAENFPEGTVFSDFALFDKTGEFEYTVSTDYTFADGVLTIIAGGAAAGLSEVRISMKATAPITSAAGVLVNSAAANESRSAAVIGKGKVYKGAVSNYSATAATLLPNVEFV